MKPDNSHLQMLDSADMMSLFRMSKTTLWRHVKEGRVPEPIYIGRAPLWHKNQVEEWLGDKMGIKPKRKRDSHELA